MDPDWMFEDAPAALGVVPDTGRGSLPFALLQGESLVAVAAWAMGEAGVELLDLTVPWSAVREAGRPLVVHDPLCPLTPPQLIAEAAARSAAQDAVVVAVRAVTDTVKDVARTHVVGTHEREDLRQVLSPLVVPASVLADLPEPGPGTPLDLDDLAASALALAQTHDVVWLEAPVAASRVSREEDLEVLEARIAVEQEPGGRSVTGDDER